MGQEIKVLNPGKFLFSSNDSCNITVTDPFKNSAAFTLDDSLSILQLKYYSPNGYDYSLADRVENNRIKMGLLKDGTYVFILHKKGNPVTLSENDTRKFVSDFLPSNGADLLAAASAHALRVNLQENFKTIIQSGNYFTENCTTPTTLPLEIVPEKNLFWLDNKPQKISFTLLYKGTPLQNTGITLVYKKDSTTAPVIQKISTNKNGKARAVIQPSGTYLMSFIMLNKPGDAGQAAWTGYASNLLWGY